MTTRQGTDSNVVLVNQEFDVVGTRPIRHDGADKVTGRARYGADFQAADLLRGRVLRSPHAHAHIKSIDTSKAEALEGVRAVVTFRDFPTNDADKPARRYQRENVLAGEKALYVGHAIAGVAAVSDHVAEEALSLIEVEYEVLPPVTSAPQGMALDSPILHEEMRTDESGEKALNPAMSPPTSNRLSAILRRALQRPISSSKGNSTPPPSIRATSSLRTAPPSGTMMADSTYGPAPRAPSP